MTQYIKKPIIVDAWQIVGNPKKAENEAPQWVMEAYAYKHDKDIGRFIYKPSIFITDNNIAVNTLEGTMKGKLLDYLVKGAFGELYIVDRTIFEMTYVKYSPDLPSIASIDIKSW